MSDYDYDYGYIDDPPDPGHYITWFKKHRALERAQIRREVANITRADHYFLEAFSEKPSGEWVWKTAQGARIPVKDMELSHLFNTISFLSSTNWRLDCKHAWLRAFWTELEKRVLPEWCKDYNDDIRQCLVEQFLADESTTTRLGTHYAPESAEPTRPRCF